MTAAAVYVLAGSLFAAGVGLVWLAIRVNALAGLVIRHRLDEGARLVDLEELVAAMDEDDVDELWKGAHERVSDRVLDRRGLRG